jgi:hypothetical protein
MDDGHISRLARGELGPRARPVYYQDLTRSTPDAAGQVNHVRVDTLGGGGFTFVDSGVPNSQPAHEYRSSGLRLSIMRPVGATTSIGEWAAVKMSGVNPPAAFLLVANFIRPSRMAGSSGASTGTYATSLLINAGALMGVTCQFQPEALRMNLPGTGLLLDRPPISRELVDQILDPQHPQRFSLALRVTRTAVVGTGRGFVHVGNLEVDSIAFGFSNLPTAVPIIDIRAGVATSTGEDYSASVDLLDFQVWA